ncbi:MAG: hypothetical protein ROO76_13095 [Terriglobia bacterium]|nr:hypothetical protein [Terriglobia bacterium]
MPIRYRCDRTKGITYVAWKGSPSRQEWQESTNRMLTDPLWPGGDLYLTDTRLADVRHLEDPPFLEQIARNFVGRVSQLKHAIVAASGYATAERFQEKMNKLGFTCIVFSSLDTACLWLGIELRETEKILQELQSESVGPPAS